MGGICGVWGEQGTDAVYSMMEVVRYRGPDETGIHSEQGITLGQARLRVAGLNDTSQPYCNEDQTVWLVCSGEIFNYPELRRELISRGHRFSSDAPNEALLHLYEDCGIECLQRVNGQFAFALWDRGRQKLFLARDRMGTMPLYYTTAGRRLFFGSEIKSLIAGTGLSAEFDPRGLAQAFTFRATVPPRTVFRDILELPAGHYLAGEQGEIRVRKYWDIDFCAPEKMPENGRQRQVLEEGIRELLADAVRIRLQAGLPVGIFFDGGLDSSLIAVLAAKHHSLPVHTFSLGFHNAPDMLAEQGRAAALIGALHHNAVLAPESIDSVLAGTVWHAEQPLFRIAPAPRYLLAQKAQQQGIRILMSSDGAAELFGGYGLASLQRPSDDGAAPLYPQLPLWNLRMRAMSYFSPQLAQALGKYNPVDDLAPSLPEGFNLWSRISRTQYLDIKLLLPGCQLSAQGDRMNMAHGLSARYPFLDFRVVERCARLPDGMKIRDSQDHYLLRHIARPLLPVFITERRHEPRAPVILPSFEDLLSQESLNRCGCFNTSLVRELHERYRKGPTTPHERFILTGIATTVLLQRMFALKSTA